MVRYSRAWNCQPCLGSLTQKPSATIASPGWRSGRVPTTVTRRSSSCAWAASCGALGGEAGDGVAVLGVLVGDALDDAPQLAPEGVGAATVTLGSGSGHHGCRSREQRVGHPPTDGSTAQAKGTIPPARRRTTPAPRGPRPRRSSASSVSPVLGWLPAWSLGRVGAPPCRTVSAGHRCTEATPRTGGREFIAGCRLPYTGPVQEIAARINAVAGPARGRPAARRPDRQPVSLFPVPGPGPARRAPARPADQLRRPGARGRCRRRAAAPPRRPPGHPDQPARHQKIRSAITWIYDLLTPRSQRSSAHCARSSVGTIGRTPALRRRSRQTSGELSEHRCRTAKGRLSRPLGPPTPDKAYA